MKKYIIWLAFILSTIAVAAAGDRLIFNPNVDKDVVISVNKGGVETPAITVTGATVSTTIGEATAGSAPALTVRSGGSSTAVINRTTSVGALVGLEFQGAGTKSGRVTSSSSNSLEIENGAGASVGSVNQAGQWSIGGPGTNQRFFIEGSSSEDTALTVHKGTGSSSQFIMKGLSNFGGTKTEQFNIDTSGNLDLAANLEFNSIKLRRIGGNGTGNADCAAADEGGFNASSEICLASWNSGGVPIACATDGGSSNIHLCVYIR